MTYEQPQPVQIRYLQYSLDSAGDVFEVGGERGNKQSPDVHDHLVHARTHALPWMHSFTYSFINHSSTIM